MDLTTVRACLLAETFVMLFQVVGVAGLCLSRLAAGTSWTRRGHLIFVVAILGLGAAGAIAGRNDSAFGLFAGGSMTLLLIGMISGSGAGDPTHPTGSVEALESGLVA
ncbi:MAG TPA: hypothetical protein VFT74_10015 [Isosphaeraceae bacterium]|nr:hypothetical protein [Isosphaeraceae bacterium]